jgi:hypothetical protein
MLFYPIYLQVRRSIVRYCLAGSGLLVATVEHRWLCTLVEMHERG